MEEHLEMTITINKQTFKKKHRRKMYMYNACQDIKGHSKMNVKAVKSL
jgi:hypothetical protein